MKLNLLVLRTPKLEDLRRFYSALGARFDSERHGNGPEHYAAMLGDDIVLELYPMVDGSRRPTADCDSASAWRTSGKRCAGWARLRAAGQPSGGFARLRARPRWQDGRTDGMPEDGRGFRAGVIFPDFPWRERQIRALPGDSHRAVSLRTPFVVVRSRPRPRSFGMFVDRRIEYSHDPIADRIVNYHAFIHGFAEGPSCNVRTTMGQMIS